MIDTLGPGTAPASSDDLTRAARRTPVRFLRVLSIALVTAYLASTVLRRPGSSSPFFDGWIGNLGYAGCTALCAWRAVVVRDQRRAWGAIAISLGLFTMGAVLWTTRIQFLDPVPYPSTADAFFLAFYPLAYLGVGMLIRDAVPRGSRAIWLDGLIAALGVAALEASIVIAGISHANRGDGATIATNLAYPIGDLVLVMMVVALFAMRGWRPGRLWWALGAGLAIFSAADSVYVLRVTAGTYVTGTVLDGLWPIGVLLMALAAWQATGPGRRDAVHDQAVVIPGLFLISSLGIVVYATWRPVLPLGVVLATGTLLVAIARLAQAYRQLQTLAESRRQARTDELTGLVNRRGFYEAINACLDPGSGRTHLGVLMIDLDRFKEINDSLGHQVGDEILRQLGPRLSAVVGQSGMVARLGGDEFGLLLAPLADRSAATQLAQQVSEVLRHPFELDAMTIRVDASIGIAIAPDDGRLADDLLKKADVAMYGAKRGKKVWEFYEPDGDVHTRDRLELMEDLRDAIDRGELVVHYQPKLDLVRGMVTGVEALVRWQHPTRGLLLPGSFLELIEQSGLIGPLAMTVLDQAMAQQRRWAAEGVDLIVSVNLSAANLMDDDLAGKIAGVMARHQADPSGLILEITEDCLMIDADKSMRILAQIQATGIRLSIDDFGTGFSSLGYLRDLPAGELKLDRTFLTGLARDPRAVSIVRSTVGLAHSLGLRLVAEGVETADELDLVTGLGCDGAQGYLLGRPMPGPDLLLSLVSSTPGIGSPWAQPPPGAAPATADAVRRGL